MSLFIILPTILSHLRETHDSVDKIIALDNIALIEDEPRTNVGCRIKLYTGEVFYTTRYNKYELNDEIKRIKNG